MIETVRKAFKSRWIIGIIVIAVYAALAVWSTWPLARSPANFLPLGTSESLTVPMFNLWTIWWNAEGFLQESNSYWTAPIFHPLERTFAFSEPQTITILMAPVFWLTHSRVLAYNLYLWLALLLNSVFSFRLLRTLGVNRSIAIGGGAAMLLLPIVHWQRDVLQLIPLWGILWTWTVLLKISRKPSLLRGAELGLAFGLTFLTCSHQGLFLAVLIPGAAWTLWKRLLNPRTWVACAVGVVVAAFLIGPGIIRLQQAAKDHKFERPSKTVLKLSALPGDYTASTGEQLIDFGTVAARPQWQLSPGWFKMGLALIGVVLGLIRKRWRWWTAFMVVTTLLAFSLSLGPNFRVHEWRPWWTLTEYCPGFSQVRNVFRFAFFVQMTIVLLAAQGLYGAFLLSRKFFPENPNNYFVKTGLLILGLIALFEVFPTSPALGRVPDAEKHSGWITFIRENTPPERAIACIPFAEGLQAKSFEITTRWMYFGTYHGVPLVNGYSGFFPKEYFDIREALSAGPPSEEILRRLADDRVEFLVVMRSMVQKDTFSNTRFDSVSLERVFSDPVGVDVYRLERVDSLSGEQRRDAM